MCEQSDQSQNVRFGSYVVQDMEHRLLVIEQSEQCGEDLGKYEDAEAFREVGLSLSAVDRRNQR